MIRWLLDLIRRALPWDGWDEPTPDTEDRYEMAVEPWR